MCSTLVLVRGLRNEIYLSVVRPLFAAPLKERGISHIDQGRSKS